MSNLQEDAGKKYGNSIGVICLILSALLWGSEYVVAKDVLNVMPANWSNVIRTFFTSIIALVLWRKQFKAATLQDWKRGFVCGGLFGIAFALQIMGLELINAGINAFISSAYVILVPFMVWMVDRKRPAGKVFISALIGVVGISILSVSGSSAGSLSIGTGEILSLLSAIGYGGAIVAVDYTTKKSSVEFITGCQFIFTCLIALVFALLMEDTPQLEVTASVVFEFLYLILFGTFATQLLFTFGMQYASANQAGVIFPLESVSATVLGCLLLHEQLRAVQVAGGILIIIAIIISNVSIKKSSSL
ncbi:MAG: DMT family transporter [Firmicutes bacterium]|nr:DMT family transporter [Bacillota bacterium]